MTERNITFEAKMIFVDAHGRTVSETELLPVRLVKGRRQGHKFFFSAGSGEMAKRASKILWRSQVTY
jgi:hypothetical protein